MSVELLCVGHATFDLTMFLPEFPPEDSKLEIRDLLESGGGPAANAAYLASLWGCSTAFAGLIGDDAFGKTIRDEFQRVGTDISLLESRPGHATPCSVIWVSGKTGSRTIVNRKAGTAVYQLPISTLPSLALGPPKCLLFDGHELEASRTALERFPHATSVLDAGSVRPGTLELAGQVDYVIASERFARQLLGVANLATEASQREALVKLESLGAKNSVITLGKRGLIGREHGEIRCLAAFPVQTVDTTGAGDVFHGAFAHGLVTGMAYWPNLRRASMAAALSVERRGGRPSIPHLSAVEHALSHVT